MDIYPMVLLGLIALILLAVVAKNVSVVPLNYSDWKAKRDKNHQRMKELNADFSAIISGE